MNKISNSKKIPITIGLAGHRNIYLSDDLYSLYENFLIEILKNISQKYPSSPLIGISGLAEGSDRLYAKTVLKAKENGINIELYCPLPFEKDEYIKYCASDKKDELKELLNNAKRVYCVGYEDDIRIDGENNLLNKPNQNQKERQYFRTDLFIADSSMILIALWDGKPTDKKSGTYFTINYKLNNLEDRFIYDTSKTRLSMEEIELLQEKHILGINSPVLPLSSDCKISVRPHILGINSPVLHICVNRENDKSFLCKNSVAYRELNRELKLKDNKASYDIDFFQPYFYYNKNKINLNFLDDNQDINKINEINKEIEDFSDKYLDKIKKEKDEIFKTNEKDNYCKHKDDSDTGDLIKDLTATFSLMSLIHQKKHRFNLRLILGMGIFITIAILIFYHMISSSYMPYMLLFVFAVIFIFYFIYNKKINPLYAASKYIEYRVAAEQLKIQYFLNIAGMEKSITTYYSSILEEDKKWIARLLKTIHSLTYSYKREILKDDILCIKEAWIKNQIDYFAQKIKAEDYNKKKFKIFQKISISLFFLMLISLAAFYNFYVKYNIAGGVLIVSNIFFILYLNFRGYFEDSRANKLISQYVTMLKIYRSINKEIKSVVDSENFPKEYDAKKMRSLLYILAKEALIENKIWAQFEFSRSLGFKF